MYLKNKSCLYTICINWEWWLFLYGSILGTTRPINSMSNTIKVRPPGPPNDKNNNFGWILYKKCIFDFTAFQIINVYNIFWILKGVINILVKQQ